MNTYRTEVLKGLMLGMVLIWLTFVWLDYAMKAERRKKAEFDRLYR